MLKTVLDYLLECLHLYSSVYRWDVAVSGSALPNRCPQNSPQLSVRRNSLNILVMCSNPADELRSPDPLYRRASGNKLDLAWIISDFLKPQTGQDDIQMIANLEIMFHF